MNISMTTSHQRDSFDDCADSGNGIVGGHLKSKKGVFHLNDLPVETGEGGLEVCAIIESMVVGQVCWDEGKIAQRDIGRLIDGFNAPKSSDIREGWNIYVSMLMVGADEAHRGELMTFGAIEQSDFEAGERASHPHGRRQAGHASLA
jgi:hypothetical protein